MSPAIASLAMFGIQEAIKHSPEIAQALRNLFSKGKEPTAEDWKREHDKIAALSYEKLVPNSRLPKD